MVDLLIECGEMPTVCPRSIRWAYRGILLLGTDSQYKPLLATTFYDLQQIELCQRCT